MRRTSDDRGRHSARRITCRGRACSAAATPTSTSRRRVTHQQGHGARRYLERFARRAALYVGDDRTDEDVFALDLPGLLSVRVGPAARLAARAFFMRDQTGVDRLLDADLDARQAPTRELGHLDR